MAALSGSNNRVICHTCAKVFKALMMRANSAEDAFATRGFHNWKLATATFRQHELSTFHKEAVERVITLPAATTDIGVARS